jgi:IS1 family transposase
MNTLKKEKRLAVLSALVEGNSIRSASRITGVHKTTIMKVLNEAGNRCAEVLDTQMRDLPCKVIECDELWTFVGKKERKLNINEKIEGRLGDQYIFVALDPETKLVPTFVIGKRDALTTHIFIQKIRDRVKGRPQITTDGFKPYLAAIEQAFGGDIDYAVLVKNYEADNPGPGRYSPPAITNIDIIKISGFPKRERICTSYVERNNLTMRLSLKRLNRLTLAFSKKLENLKAAISIHFAYYNFCRVHGTLRITPAMQAGLTDHIWSLEDIAA